MVAQGTFDRKFNQLRLLLWKNWLFSIRSWKATALQLVAPFAFIILVWGLSRLPQALEDELDPPVLHVKKFPHCVDWNGQNCTSLYVQTSQSTAQLPPATITCIDTILKNLSADSNMRYQINSTADIKWIQYETLNDTMNNIRNHPNRTQAMLIFHICSVSLDDPGSSKLEYTIVFNSSRALRFQQVYVGSLSKPDGRTELQRQVDQHFMSQVLQREIKIDVSTKDYPKIYLRVSTETQEAANASVFLFCGITFQFVMMLYNIVSEKDLKLRQGLKVMGLKDSIYWLSWAITGMIIAFLSTIIIMATGYAVQLEFFLNTNFLINFLFFFIYSSSMIPLAFFASVFINTIQQAVNMGMLVFIIGLIFVSIVGSQFILSQLYAHVELVIYILSFLPPFQFAKAISDIGEASSPTNGLGLPTEKHFFSWHELTEEQKLPDFTQSTNENGTYKNIILPPTIESFYWLVGDALLFGLLAWYLDAIWQGNHGIPRRWYFPLTWSYWFGELKSSSSVSAQERVELHKATSSTTVSTMMDNDDDDYPDMQEVTTRPEESSLLSPGHPVSSAMYGASGTTSALRIEHLSKTYDFSCSSVRKLAVNGLSLAVEQDQLLTLLGHNGAGKSTTINMLTGLLSPSGGNAYLYDLNIKEHMDEIRTFLGVCPQHDILWADLTAREHMQIFSQLKGVPKTLRNDEINTLLANVQLNTVADHRVSTFSGGMKRRLTVAITFLGDPRVVFLDEPTTGMDPRIRRDIWNLILKMKENRVTIMTTHSMEEADILGDNIVIMANGELKVAGSSVNLKNRFAGYNIELVVKQNAVNEIMEMVAQHLPGGALKFEPFQIEGGVILVYNLPPDKQEEIVPFFEFIENDRKIREMMIDSSVSQTTLEEVFLNVTTRELYPNVDPVEN
ncbi:ABC transporter A family member 1-like [Dysidea avara]|uniref:ABC transporter A family member 1-like n=1 Tax=Dysidea avara TaxID=196820 RepID=UPI00332CEA0E